MASTSPGDVTSLTGYHVSNGKKTWLFRVRRGWNPSQVYRDYSKTIIKIPTTQPGFYEKYVFLTEAHMLSG